MSYSNTSSNTSASCSLLKNWKSAILEIFIIESTSEFQTPVFFFFISERKHKLWVIIFLYRNEHFGTKIVFLEFFVFVPRSSSFSVGRQKRYAT